MNNRLIDEICANGKLTEFRAVINNLVENVYASDFTLSCRYDCKQSSIEWTKRHIRISLKKDSLKIIWDILHELGHLQSGERINSKTININREINAWNNALIELKKYPELLDNVGQFKDYQNFCLKTYYDKINKPSA